jgi:PiT family inorganic phosphate transporter
MNPTFGEFLRSMVENPSLLVTVILTLGVILVNGWTDAPNAIATCISTRSMSPKAAIAMASVFNLGGVVVMSIVSKQVAETIYTMVNFGGDASQALVALCAAMVAIVVFAIAAWKFGIPTSESHALIAGLSGAAIALQNGFSGINGSQWVKVLYGLVLSTLLGFGLGWLMARLVNLLFRRADRRKANSFFRGAQIFASAAMAFMHGAQDGLKFIGVFMLGISLAGGHPLTASLTIPVWLMLLCSGVMALGTSIGGYRIIKAVGMDMVRLSRSQGFAADLAGAVCLLLASVTGLPVRTTHTNTTAIMGVGAEHRISSVNWNIVKEMLSAWVLTFPICGIIGYLMAKLFIAVF